MDKRIKKITWPYLIGFLILNSFHHEFIFGLFLSKIFIIIAVCKNCFTNSDRWSIWATILLANRGLWDIHRVTSLPSLHPLSCSQSFRDLNFISPSVGKVKFSSTLLGSPAGMSIRQINRRKADIFYLHVRGTPKQWLGLSSYIIKYLEWLKEDKSCFNKICLYRLILAWLPSCTGRATFIWEFYFLLSGRKKKISVPFLLYCFSKPFYSNMPSYIYSNNMPKCHLLGVACSGHPNFKKHILYQCYLGDEFYKFITICMKQELLFLCTKTDKEGPQKMTQSLICRPHFCLSVGGRWKPMK